MLMLTQAEMNPSIYGWKRTIILPNPEATENMDTSCQIFLTDSLENICKSSIIWLEIQGEDCSSYTTDKLIQLGIMFDERRVMLMDAMFDVRI